MPFYLVSGAGDELGIAFETAQFSKLMAGRQPDRVDLHIVEGRHDWSVWNNTLDDALTYLYRYVPHTHAAAATRLKETPAQLPQGNGLPPVN